MAILTNYDLPEHRYGKSRGQLVHYFLSTNFVEQENSFEAIHEKIKSKFNEINSNGKDYAAFNLIIYHIPSSKIFYTCSENKMD